MVIVREVSKFYGSRAALDGVSLDIRGGQVWGLWGANGAGKTTLVKMLAGLAAPDRGTVRVHDEDPSKSWRVRRNIGVVMADDDFLFPELTGRELLWWIGRLRGLDEGQCREQTRGLSEKLGVAERLDDLSAALSHGLRGRLALATALMANPKLLLLDEPINGFDTTSKRAAAELLNERSQAGTAIILSSHDPTFLKANCTHALLLETGRIRAAGPITSFHVAGDVLAPRAGAEALQQQTAEAQL